MKNKNKLIIIAAFFAMILSMVPTLNVKAANKDIEIISDTNVTAKEAAKWAESKGATETFIELADLYWQYAEDHGNVNPGVAYVQAAKETGLGKFGGVIDESYCNPCGLKTSAGGNDNDASAHMKFSSWKEGVQAHLDHLALYAGASGYPRSDTNDPRHFATLKGRASTVNSLGVNWAPSSTYGEEVNTLYRNMVEYSSEKIGNEEIEESSNNTSKESNVETSKEPYPAAPESKPAGLNAEQVVTKSDSSDEQDNKENDNSSIGWKKEDGTWHYYKSDGTKATGWLKSNDNWYLFSREGNMLTGWVNDGGSFYYFNAAGIMAKGWNKINDFWYYFNNVGKMSVGAVSDGSKLYYFDGSGKMETSWGWKQNDNKWYYFNKDNSLKTGWFKNNNMWYYLQGDGSMVTGYKTIDSKVYAFDDGGKMLTGWKQVNGTWYYFDNSGAMLKDWQKVNGTWYYFYDNGAMAKGWLKLNNSWYYLKDSGAMVTGWVTYNNDRYYLDAVSGRLVTNTAKDGYTIGSDGKAVSNAGKENSSTSNTTSNSGNSSNSTTPSNTQQSNTNTSTGGYDRPQAGRRIVIDAGHNYGGDYGATYTINGIKYDETVLNMQVAVKLKAELESRGYTVIMTRDESDRSTTAELQSLINRVNIANNANADLFISIHHNVAGATASGVEVYYSSKAQDESFGGAYSADRVQKSKTLAASVASKIAAAVNTTNRGAKDSGFKVVKNTKMPAILIETGFITNPTEAARCADPNSQLKVAKAIADAVQQF